MPCTPVARALSVLKAAWLDDLHVSGATRSVPESDMPRPDPGVRTVPVLVTRQDVREELQALVDGQDEATERFEFEESKGDFREELRRERDQRLAAAQVGLPS